MKKPQEKKKILDVNILILFSVTLMAVISVSIATPAHPLIAGLAPPRQCGAFMSVNGMIIRLGQTLGPLMAATAFGIGGLFGVFYAAAGFSIVVIFMLAVLLQSYDVKREIE